MIEIKLQATSHKSEKYSALVPQIRALLNAETDAVANMANLSAVLYEHFDFLWVGFYIMRDTSLILGPFQGPIACTRIQIGKGVCGKSAEEKEAIIVADVNSFPGHIACSPLSKSEIVIPAVKNNRTIFVLDIDSDQHSAFDEIDQKFLEEICTTLLECSDWSVYNF